MKEIIRINTIGQVHEFYGLKPPQHPLVSVLAIDDHMTSFDYGDLNYAFDFYHISLKMGISGSMVYGRNSYDFQEGTMTFIKPGQVVKVISPEEVKNSIGWTLLFHPDLIRTSTLGRDIEQFNFFNYEVNEALHLSEDEKRSLTQLVAKIEEEYHQKTDKFTEELIVANIEMILKYCQRFYSRQFYTRSLLNKDLISKFEKVISDYYQSDLPIEHGVLSVKYCAGKMNMSSNYLGDLIKNETGKSPKDHIRDHLIGKAKTAILGSNKSISEIAYDFGFEHPQGFTKLFKSKTGMSPKAYRKQQ
ncbi:MAG: helix-turn-helix domain-containing protein [Bacteroidota bacterium]